LGASAGAALLAFLIWPRDHSPDVSAFTILSLLEQTQGDAAAMEAALGALYDTVTVTLTEDQAPRPLLRHSYGLERDGTKLAGLDCTTRDVPARLRRSEPSPFDLLRARDLTADRRVNCVFHYGDEDRDDLWPAWLQRIWPWARARDLRTRTFALHAEIWAEHNIGPLQRDGASQAKFAVASQDPLRAVRISRTQRSFKSDPAVGLIFLADID